jgi:hypothetical protein
LDSRGRIGADVHCAESRSSVARFPLAQQKICSWLFPTFDAAFDALFSSSQILFLDRSCAVRGSDLKLTLDRRFPVQHALLGDFEQVATVLCQEVERVGDVRDVFYVAFEEALAVQGLEQIAGRSDALEGGFEDVLGVGLCVDD